MAKYKDRHGTPIKVGDVIAAAITINHETFRGFSFDVRIIKKKGRELIADGVHGWCRLSERAANELVVLKGDTDLTRVHCDLSRDFGPK